MSDEPTDYVRAEPYGQRLASNSCMSGALNDWAHVAEGDTYLDLETAMVFKRLRYGWFVVGSISGPNSESTIGPAAGTIILEADFEETRERILAYLEQRND